MARRAPAVTTPPKDDRWARLLSGLWIHRHAVKIVEPAMKIHHLSPRALENLDTLVSHRAALSVRQAKDIELLLHPAGANPKHQTAAGEQIDGGELPRVAERIPIRGDQHARAQLERGRAGCHRTHRDRSIQHIVTRLVCAL